MSEDSSVAVPATSVAAAYEPPQLRLLGTVQELTEWCFFGKNIGQPDYFQQIPITNCSA